MPGAAIPGGGAVYLLNVTGRVKGRGVKLGVTTYPYLEVLLDRHRSLAGGHTCPELETTVRTTFQICRTNATPCGI